MTDHNLLQSLVSIETEGWQALSNGTGAEYYERNLTENALMVFPFGVLDRNQSIESIRSAPPWSTFHIAEPRVVALSDQSAVLTYHATAQRADDAAYEAWMTTVYVRNGERWLTAYHQQTPMNEGS